jgi:hypothetical protein
MHDQAESPAVKMLRAHRRALLRELTRIQRQITQVDRAIARLQDRMADLQQDRRKIG